MFHQRYVQVHNLLQTQNPSFRSVCRSMRLYLLCLGLFEYTDLTPLLVCVLCVYIYTYVHIYICIEQMYICDTRVQIIY
jgi:hypothetical protein